MTAVQQRYLALAITRGPFARLQCSTARSVGTISSRLAVSGLDVDLRPLAVLRGSPGNLASHLAVVLVHTCHALAEGLLGIIDADDRVPRRYSGRRGLLKQLLGRVVHDPRIERHDISVAPGVHAKAVIMDVSAAADSDTAEVVKPRRRIYDAGDEHGRVLRVQQGVGVHDRVELRAKPPCQSSADGGMQEEGEVAAKRASAPSRHGA